MACALKDVQRGTGHRVRKRGKFWRAVGMDPCNASSPIPESQGGGVPASGATCSHGSKPTMVDYLNQGSSAVFDREEWTEAAMPTVMQDSNLQPTD